mmetsp:Transcript_7588/g.16531  ORF Transcript_7588/g.16531 Transcript_7588/m.16531 type:complete len:385 (-) Transcript_7588:335-1489(-)
MDPPTCRFTGKHIRLLLLLAFLSYFVYFLVHGLEQPPSSRAVYICDTENKTELTQCDSLQDDATCANLLDADGNIARCIESSCGFQLFPHVDVSIAGSSDPYDVDAATYATSFESVMSIAYSIVPYLMGFIYLVLFLASGNLVPATRLVVLGVIALVNEALFKSLIKQDRPIGSCLYFGSHGMPSGHSASSIGLLTYLLLELFVYHPNLLCGLTCQRSNRQNAYSYRAGYGWQRQMDDDNDDSEDADAAAGDSVAIDINNTSGVETNDAISPDPLLEKNQSSCLRSSESSSWRRVLLSPFAERWIYHWYALGYFLLLFPVPMTRVYLHDHSRNQVLLGGVIGVVASLLWYLGIVRRCGVRLIEWSGSRWGKWWGLKFGWEEGFF